MGYDCIVIGAHPDDPFIGAGGTIAKYTHRGRRVLIVCATNGSNGGDKILGTAREGEFHSAVTSINADGMVLNFEDGILPFRKEEMQNVFLQLFIENNPQEIYFHHKHDSNLDHIAVHDAVYLAISILWHRLQDKVRLTDAYQFMPVKLGIRSLELLDIIAFHDISEFVEEKRTAVLMHKSQQPYLSINLKAHEKLSEFVGDILQIKAAECFSCDMNAYENSIRRLV